jgi:glycosyltransferase involved in cell wall biosynthesis
MWYVGPFCSTMEIPYIFTVLDLQHRVQPYFPEISNDGIWESREKVYSHELRRASYVIVSTNVGKAEIEKFYQIPADRISVLPYAAPQLDHEQINGSVLHKYGLEPGYLFYPAQFWPEKNHIGLLKAIRLLRDKWNINIKVVFVGSDRGNLTFVKEWITQLDLEDQVYILGFIPREDLMALYKHALALTMPTLVGPDNIPSLEAFALRCPVITSNISGFQEQLGDAALLINPTDEEQIALAIKSLLDDNELRESLIIKGLERISKWSWIDYVKGFLSIADKFQPIRRTWGKKLS